MGLNRWIQEGTEMEKTINGRSVIRVRARYHNSPEEVKLMPRQLLTLDGDRRGEQILAVYGSVWITQVGDREDHLLRAGECFTISRKGKVVIEGMRPARLRLFSG